MGIKTKIKMILKNMNPVSNAERELKNEREALAKDKME